MPSTRSSTRNFSSSWVAYEAMLKECAPISRGEEEALTCDGAAALSPSHEACLVRAHLRLVVAVVRECVPPTDRLYMDLIQEGNAGLLQAIRRFDPSRGVKLSTYATYWIRAYVYRHLMANWRLVRVGSTQRQREVFFHASERRRRQDSEEDLLVEHVSNPEASTQAAVAGVQDGVTLGDTLAAPEDDRPDHQMEEKQARDWFTSVWQTFVARLGDRDRAIVEARGVGQGGEGAEPVSLASIGRQLDLTRERVRQIESRIQTQFIEFARASMGTLAATAQA